ncbi:TonB family protein [candidate division KSB1 bacterium]|nr:TonB family protein [candidate division KSB1 bacterium]
MKLAHSNIQRGFLLSIVIHLCVLVLFIAVRFNRIIEIPEFVEIRFERGSGALNPAVEQMPVERTARNEFDLPVKRDVRLQEDQIIDFNDKEKFVPSEEVNIVNEQSDEKTLPELKSAEAVSEKEVADITMDQKIVPDIRAIPGTAGDSPYQIEGKAAKRTILTRVIPQYPENVQQEAVIKIRFSVLPNGLVGEMIPVLKSNDMLERITLDAFKQWRFNPLPPDVEQIPEYGTITFKYLLQ